jgi:hypothetical protein
MEPVILAPVDQSQLQGKSEPEQKQYLGEIIYPFVE